MEQHLIHSTKFYQKNSRWFMPLLLLGLALIFAACTKKEPSSPSRNLFYEVQVVSVAGDQPVPFPTTVSGTALNLAATDETLFEPDLTASWSINWNCSSDHCEFQQCTGSAHSAVRDVLDERWLEIDRRIDWNEDCGKANVWLSQVDRYSGQERYPGQNALFNFWVGAKAGQVQEQITLIDGRKVNVWCTGPTKAEVIEDDGWMGLFDGEVCYDVRTGMLVFMSYIKRWVFTGIFEGKSYERAYFGDSETYEQLLETTNAQLSFVEE